MQILLNLKSFSELNPDCVAKNVPARLLGTRFEARNCICEPGPQDAYWGIF
jgi:hypothetical protein